MFYTFNQNNSGGVFDFDKKQGITHHVIIEADTPAEADSIAESIGIYFNGCDDGRDCSCCGDRWYSPYGEGTKKPEVYGKSLKAWDKPDPRFGGPTKWMEEGFEICVHYKNGKKEWA